MADPSATPVTPTPVTDVPTAAAQAPLTGAPAVISTVLQPGTNETPAVTTNSAATPAPETTGDDGLAKLATNTPETPDNSTATDDAKLPAGLIPDKAYDVLKWVAIIVLPALATFVVGLGGIWGYPVAGSIAATITAIGVLLGAVLGLSAVQYNSGK